MIKVVEISLPLKGMFMKCVEAVESEDSIWSREGRRKPALPQELCPSVECVVSWAVAIIDIHSMDTRSVENHEARRSRRWTGANAPRMSKLNAESEIFKRYFVEKLVGPSLKHESILVLIFP